MKFLKSGKAVAAKEEHWIPLSDLMTGLMMMFMLVAIVFMVKVEAEAVKVRTLVWRIGDEGGFYLQGMHRPRPSVQVLTRACAAACETLFLQIVRTYQARPVMAKPRRAATCIVPVSQGTRVVRPFEPYSIGRPPIQLISGLGGCKETASLEGT